MQVDVRMQLWRLVQGDEEAAAWLYETFATRLYRRLRGRYGPIGLDADDLLQDAFVFFFQNNARLLRKYLERGTDGAEAEEDLFRYLWDQACGIATNRLRSAKRHRAEGGELDETLPDFDPGRNPKRLLDVDVLRRLDRCLGERGQRIHLYFKLRFRDGFSPDEISQITGWSKKATYKLRQALTEAVELCVEQLGLAPG